MNPQIQALQHIFGLLFGGNAPRPQATPQPTQHAPQQRVPQSPNVHGDWQTYTTPHGLPNWDVRNQLPPMRGYMPQMNLPDYTAFSPNWAMHQVAPVDSPLEPPQNYGYYKTLIPTQVPTRQPFRLSI